MKRKMAHGENGVIKFNSLLNYTDIPRVLDIGSGEQETHANYLRARGCIVDTVDFHIEATYQGNYNNIIFKEKYNGIHAAHVLEHQLNPHNFLKKIHGDLYEGGHLCITVPPLKHQIVGGHVSLWNAGLILYHLILAGFNCSKDIYIKEYGYNITVIVKKRSIKKELELTYAGPDLITINEYMPIKLNYDKYKRFNGDIKSYS